jgi:alanine racemase
MSVFPLDPTRSLGKTQVMNTATVSVDLDAVVANWRALDRLSATGVQTAAVVKANSYGLGAARIGRALARAGVRRFFVASAHEGADLRQALGPGPQINLLSGHQPGETEMIHDLDLTPVLASLPQITRHLESLPGHAFGLQLDLGMSRLGIGPAEWEAIAPFVLEAGPDLIMAQLSCSDDPGHPLNETQLATFHAMTDGTGVPRSLSATAGIILGPRYHFDLTRPGIGLYGGVGFAGMQPVVGLHLPVIQTREVAAGTPAGYGALWQAPAPTRIATLGAGYADGISRTLSNRAVLWDGDQPCPLVGRVSMDYITVDIGHLPGKPEWLDMIGPHQGLEDLAAMAGTISYEILTALGRRYHRHYFENQPRDTRG